MRKAKRVLLAGGVAMLLTFVGCANTGQNEPSSQKVNQQDTVVSSKPKDEMVEQVNSADRLNPQKGGADAEASVLRENVMNASDELEIHGNKFYVSAETGNDDNDGTSPETAWKTISGYAQNRSKIKEGDAVLFERGGIYRGNIDVKSGVTYGAYGTGQKPAIWGSKENYVGKGSWKKTSIENVWMCSDYITDDVGTIIFNHGQAAAIRRYGDWETLEENLKELVTNFEYYHDVDNARLYLYLEKNPGEAFYDIEICGKEHIMKIKAGCENIKIDNLSIKYTGAHGISAGNGVKNISITNCEMGWIGGSFLNDTTRYGNAIEFWQGCSNILIENNWIYQCYDTGITHQGGFVQEDIAIRGNLVEYCTWGMEFWTENGPENVWKNIVYENNIIRFSGYGWGMVRPDQNRDATICGWGNKEGFIVENFVIQNNIFDVSKTYMVMQHYENGTDITYDGNTWYQRAGVAALWNNSERLEATDQTMLEASIKKIDPNAKLIKLIQ